MKRSFLVLIALMPALLTACGGRAGILPGMNRIGQMSGLQASDEEQIVVLLDDVQQGMERRQIYKVLAHVSRNYYDEAGRDYAGIEAYLTDLFKRYRQINITRVVPRIAIYGTTARAIETFGTTAEPQDPGTEPPIYLQGQVTVNLEKVNNIWQIVEWGAML